MSLLCGHHGAVKQSHSVRPLTPVTCLISCPLYALYNSNRGPVGSPCGAVMESDRTVRFSRSGRGAGLGIVGGTFWGAFLSSSSSLHAQRMRLAESKARERTLIRMRRIMAYLHGTVKSISCPNAILRAAKIISAANSWPASAARNKATSLSKRARRTHMSWLPSAKLSARDHAWCRRPPRNSPATPTLAVRHQIPPAMSPTQIKLKYRRAPHRSTVAPAPDAARMSPTISTI